MLCSPFVLVATQQRSGFDSVRWAATGNHLEVSVDDDKERDGRIADDEILTTVLLHTEPKDGIFILTLRAGILIPQVC